MRQYRSVPGWVSPLVAFLFLCALALVLVTGIKEKPPGDEAVAVVQRAIARAAVQCYALEGAYPPDVQYLKDNYNLMIDEDRFHCSLETAGSNLFPAIYVVPMQGGVAS